MSKKINFGTINTASLEKFSKYHVAYLELKGLRTVYRNDMEKLVKEETDILEKRKTALANGENTDEVIAKYSVEEVRSKMRKREAEYKKDCEPHNTAKREALALISDNLYHAYFLSMQKGDLSAKGTVIIPKGKKSEEYTLDKSFKGIVCDFLDTIGCRNQENTTALDKFAQIMTIRTSGVVRNNKGEDYVKAKSSAQFKDIFMLAFLQYVIVEKGVVTVNDDGTLSMTEYEAE